MKILHVYKDYHPVIGGVENHIKDLAEAQAARGHLVTVLVTSLDRRTSGSIEQHVRVIRVGRLFKLASTPVSLGFPRVLAHQTPDVTHLHFPYPLGEISQLLAGSMRPFVIGYHSDVVNPAQQLILRFYRPLLAKVLRRADQIIATSQNYIESSTFLRPHQRKCSVVPLGVDPGRFDSARPLLPASDLKTMLFVGRHRYYKGLEDLLQAMQKIQARLIIAGDGPLRSNWERSAQKLGLVERVRFLGDVDQRDLPGVYASADIFVLPANMRAEAFGMVLLEAMAAGLPCVTTELGTGTSFVVQDGVTGFVVPPNDPDELARGINRLLGDDELRRRMGETGSRRVKEDFTLELMVDRIEAVYRRVLENSASQTPSMRRELPLGE